LSYRKTHKYYVTRISDRPRAGNKIGCPGGLRHSLGSSLKFHFLDMVGQFFKKLMIGNLDQHENWPQGVKDNEESSCTGLKELGSVKTSLYKNI